MYARAPLAVAAVLLIAGCDDVAPDVSPIEPDLAGGKADVADRVDDGGTLSFDAPVAGAFVEDLQFIGHRLHVRAGADVRLDVTHLGTAAKLDTTMFVYGPITDAGGFGTEAIAFDDDDGWGKHSRIDEVFAEGGEYLVVLGTADGRGRGHYRLLATCNSGACEPEPEPDPEESACHPWVASNVLACFRGQYADAELDPETATPTADEVLAVCTDGEALGPIYDNTCAAPSPPEYCADDFATFAQTMGPACAIELAPYAVECTFGSTYAELFTADNLAIGRRRELTVDSTLSPLEAQQVIAAVLSASFTEIATVEEAFEAADQGEINQIEVYDRSSAQAYLVYELGAGDTSVGAYFEVDGAEAVAVNGDGDLERCRAAGGPLDGACGGDGDCPTSSECVGVSPDTGLGRCVDLATPDGGESCTIDTGCALAEGMMCAGLSRSDTGMCLPAWMRRSFSGPPTAFEIPDGDAAGIDHPIDVSGLATVDMDVEIDLVIRHPDPSQLRITLTNPDGNEVSVFDGTGGEPFYTRIRGPLLGLSGDESVNGTWTLHMVDTTAGDAGEVEEVALMIGSRWD